MSTDPTNNLIKSRLRDIFPDEITANKVIDLVVTNKPKNWGRKSQAPYYKEYFALQIKEHADAMLRDKQDRIFRYDIYCGEKREKMSEQTLYNRINQSKRYLLDCLDPAGTYATWDALTNISFKGEPGIVIRFKSEFHNVLDGIIAQEHPETIIPKKEESLWRRKMNLWLEGDETKPFIQPDLALTLEEVEKLRSELGELKGIMAVVNAISVKIVRVSEQ